MAGERLKERIKRDTQKLKKQIEKRKALREAIRAVQLRVNKIRARRHKRRLKLDRIQAQRGPKAAVAWALDQVGTKEYPAYSNTGPKISDWQRATLGTTGWPWCQAFVNAAYVHGGGKQFHSAYTPDFVNWAASGTNGLKKVSTPQLGDFVYFDFDGGVVDHVGMYVGNGKTVEGNTSAGTIGSQDNGGTVAIRTRYASQIRAYVRPTW